MDRNSGGDVPRADIAAAFTHLPLEVLGGGWCDASWLSYWSRCGVHGSSETGELDQNVDGQTGRFDDR